MIEIMSSRLGVKLFIMLTAVITLSIAPLAYISVKAINRYGNEVTAVSEEQIRSQAFSYLKKITRERAGRYQGFFDRIRASAGMLGTHASSIYSDLDYFASKPRYRSSYVILPHNGFWASADSEPIISMYWGSSDLGAAVQKQLDALTHMTPLFTRVLDENPEALASHMITMSGIGQYCTRNEQNKKTVRNLPPLSVFDLRQGEPLTIFTRSDDRTSGVRWTDVYKDDVNDGLMLTASVPIHDTSGVFQGIAGIDVPLDTIIDDILAIEDPDAENPILFAFLTDNDGRLIAFPEKYHKRFGISFDPGSFNDSSDSLELSLADSITQQVRELGMLIAGGRETFSRLDLQDDPLFVATSRLPELDWVFGLVVRQKDMFASVDKSRTTLKNTIRTMELKGLLVSLLTILTALAIVFLSIKYLVTPLRTLASATARVARGDLSVRCPVTSGDETGILAASFNTMVERLQQTQENQLRKSLEEKEILLKEIYHRTKNNMLVIISMLDLQMQDVEDDRILSIFKDTEYRIRAMALVHEKLYQSQDLSEIDLGSYLEDVVRSLVANMVPDGRVRLDIRVEATPITIDYAIPLGLVINEIVTNAVKHAFPGRRAGTISLTLTRERDKKIRLEIGDDGVGLPEHVDIHQGSTFGMQLVNSLVKMQLRGEFSVECGNGGTIFFIMFGEPAATIRV
ncbi:MAG: histidine kinase dimerization/phosphoacceptor domain -containing protein [Desulfocapsaceae bacterium]|nr:histidine kinase dimerization/phosphoacceptor domain -containing protein [Desulfocapsaceae bacterium]